MCPSTVSVTDLNGNAYFKIIAILFTKWLNDNKRRRAYLDFRVKNCVYSVANIC